MATTATVAPKAAPVSTDGLLVLLCEMDPPPVVDKAFIEKVGQSALAAAWARGEVEFGRTKHITTGNPSIPDFHHNGVAQSRPAVVIEDGVEWTGPKQRWHKNLAGILAETLPVARAYQKYQREVCVNREKDVWEWLEAGEDPGERETRWARRNCDRAEAERLFLLYVRLTDKGLSGLSGTPNA